MQDYQRDFISFVLEIEALRFGRFVLKSGRKSPYFLNTGVFNTGGRLNRLASAYAGAIQEAALEYDMLFGPAYKGIPLVAGVATRLFEEYALDVPYCFNRKETKDHGEGGMTVGAPLAGRVLIVDDVISAGTSVRESLEIITSAGATAVGVAIALDRQERGTGARSAIQEVRDMGLSVISIISLDDIAHFLKSSSIPDAHATLEAIDAYRSQYGT